MEKEIEINIKMRLIGYYMSDDQFMRTEQIFLEKAEELAALLKKTFETISENRYVSDEMRAVFNGNTVFILKGDNGHLYGYYPKYNIARITKVSYVKPTSLSQYGAPGMASANDAIAMKQKLVIKPVHIRMLARL